MKVGSLSFVLGLVLSAILISSILLTPASAAVTTSSTYIKNVANVLNNVEYSLTPEDVQATADGGSIALALNQSSNGLGVSWLVKLDASGSPQWQEEVGCFSTPPGAYADGVSLQQTADGGYIVGGGTIGCGSKKTCPALIGITCGLVEKLDSSGRLVWAQVYSAGAGGSAITQINSIKQTTDSGFLAVGSATDASQNTGALILKLDSRGNVQWQRELGPAGSTQAYLNAVQQTADGGYVATGAFYVPSASTPRTGVLVVKFDSNGNVRWQQGFNTLDSTGSPSAAEHALSIIQTSEGGYLIAGNWDNTTSPGPCCEGALLLKLDANGNIQWQKAYSGGVYCFFNGYSETCTAIGGVIYSLHQTSDGGYVLAGDGDLILSDSTPPVPWLAKVDASGDLLWQYFYYQTYQPTGRPLSQYFASSTLTNGGGYLALGYTENYNIGKTELFSVQTDSAGLVGSCSQVHPATPLSAIDPGLATLAPALPAQTTIAAQGNSPSKTLATSVSSTSGQC